MSREAKNSLHKASKNRERRTKRQGCDPSEVELMSAVESLYRDELRPYGRILRKRLAELAEQQGLQAPTADVSRLCIQCSACPRLEVDIEDGLEWSATVIGYPANFVDIYDAEDIYPEWFWNEARNYFESTQVDDMSYPGGRYACAQGLVSLDPPFLSGYSLGRVCHFVQLAMTQRKILGYCNGAIVPYARSETMLKERCAQQQMLYYSKLPPLPSWNVFQSCLCELLRGLPEGIPLSNVKRLFRKQYQAALSETVLGHATLSELFRDERLKKVCAVQLLKHGYHVFPLSPEGKKYSDVDATN
eukprot:TRINITY_DN49220_c0_g1_i1.p1 TRINITY_DN49220_c0_g1~~TRINITY_DN49220_c0_g1_i1.p1  ORF type:complete len:303 (+),score=40.53 TRINITY_DN49220_c0_g1_i1:83-991(+)